MLEIVPENKVAAKKIFENLNQEEKKYLVEMIADEMPSMTLMAVARATQSAEQKLKAMEELATRKYEVMMND